MGFTAAELAEMASADAEIEASFCFTNEEVVFSRILDREAILEDMDTRGRAMAEAQRRYREANKEKVSEGKRAMRDLRRTLGMTQHAFAALLGVTQPTVSRWERVSAPENWVDIINQYKGAHTNDENGDASEK